MIHPKTHSLRCDHPQSQAVTPSPQFIHSITDATDNNAKDNNAEDNNAEDSDGVELRQEPRHNAATTPQSERATPTADESLHSLCLLMREMLAEQRHQSSLLEDLVDHTCRLRRKKEGELANWRRTHPRLAIQCRQASAKLSEIQTDYLHTIVEDVLQNYEGLSEGEFLLTEFVDRFGIRFTHLNNLVQTLAQLGNTSESVTDKTHQQLGK
ncbi:MAG: hypothetical protein ACRC46_11145 [Thermoguttaceae bacterium]